MEEVLEELLPTQNKSYDLGLKLKVPEYELEAIHAKSQPAQDRLREVLTLFLKGSEV